jgi:hypothetical protein
MNRIVFNVAFAIGLAAVLWVGWGFVATSPLALAMTVVIAAVYVLGALELRQFRTATAALATALADLAQPLADIRAWLDRVPPALRNPVRLRIEGERAVLPGPALTPYLVGLLVMLGMLGTFLGMVVTFKGAVFALEGSTDLQAIRSALAAPIKGLGLSFGTSVAGVAASAMLGLLSALSRRERQEVVRQLDSNIATVLRPFSRTQQQHETFKALQQQAHALPEVVDKLQALMDGLERRSQQLDAQLLGQQAQFHRDATQAYTDLASTVGASLKDSLTSAAKAAGDTIKPVVETAMAEIAAESTRVHTRVFDTTQAQLNELTERVDASARGLATHFSTTAQGVTDSFAATARGLTEGLDTSARGLTEHFGKKSEGVAESFAAAARGLTEGFDTHARVLAQHLDVTARSLTEGFDTSTRGASDGWTSALQRHADTSAAQVARLDQALAAFTTSFDERAASLLATVQQAATRTQAEQAAAEQQRLQAWTESLEAMAATLHGQWQEAGAQTLAHQQTVALALEKTAGEITARTSEQASQALTDMTQLLTQAQAMVRERIAAEAQWTQSQAERMDQLATLWRSELGALRTDEATRGNAAVERLGALQAALATQLATLGTALEAPMTRLMQTAAEAPQAAAEVIAQLRQEMSHLAERDNAALEERRNLVGDITTLMQTLNQASAAQREAIEALVASASTVLDNTGNQFAQTLAAQTAQATDAAAQVAGSAIDLASLGESFNHGVQLFSSSNDKLMDSLQRIEAAMGQQMARSDEQLAYYVAQAREVIDLSITAQQGLVEDLRRRDSKPQAAPAASTAAATPAAPAPAAIPEHAG